MDSIYVMEKLISEGHTVVSIHVNVASELSDIHADKAKLFADYYGIDHKEIKIDFGIDVHNYKRDIGVDDVYAGICAYQGVVSTVSAASLARMLGCSALYTGQYPADFIDYKLYLKMMAGVLGSEYRSHSNPVPHPTINIGIESDEILEVNEWARNHPMKDHFIYCKQSYPPCGECYKCETRTFLR
ncbi:MAG: hypothetical protein RBT33_00800 [Candidatus Dojkabacteria bacterium]|nr:hypothetical protein [Candidatus Dojkabacteria bacterium]MDX9738891.1 hypothetical protein [Candidatus Dojkabacteria bacterium]